MVAVVRRWKGQNPTSPPTRLVSRFDSNETVRVKERWIVFELGSGMTHAHAGSWGRLVGE